MRGLIIQGPILSKGRTGRTSNIQFKNVTSQDIVEFNCISTIKNIFENFTKYYDRILCVTWADQPRNLISSLVDSIGRENILLIEDNTKELSSRGDIIGGNNKYRQFYSMLKGLEYLSAHGCTSAVKIRTDQYVDCKLLIEHTEKILDKSNKIIIPWLNPRHYSTVTEIPDFYFGGEINKLIKACKCYLERKEIHDSVHTDLFFHWSMLDSEISMLNHLYLKTIARTGFSFLTNKIVIESWSNCFTLFPEAALRSVKWRGEKLSIDKEDYKIYFYDGINIESHLTNDNKLTIFKALNLATNRFKRFLKTQAGI